MRRPAGCNSGGCGENPGRRTDKERRTGMVGTGRMHRLIPVAALALAGHRIDVGVRAWSWHRRHSPAENL
jgi:hypothetical protein